MSAPKLFPKLGYAVCVEPHADDDGNVYYCDFEVFTLLSEGPPPLYDDDGCVSPSPTEDIERADCVIRGYVKWDGCANFQFCPDDPVKMHTCGKQEAVDIGTILGHVYDMAREFMPEAE